MTHLNSELLKKYNVAGPRYTSYPTVPYWETTPTAQQWVESIARALDETERSGTGAAIYIHIPFCQSLCTYCGCNTRITRNTAVGRPYIETVLKEWGLYRERLNKYFNRTRIPVSEIHLGGGTPTFLSTVELETLMNGILETVELMPGAEFSLEADPRVTTRDQLASLAKLGFRRLSLGIQDFDPKVQEIVHRTQSVEQVRGLTQAARDLGFTSINYDLIYGLPLQTAQSIRETVERVRELRPDRIAFYAYAHVPWIKPSQRRYTEADIPDGEAKRALYELGRELLEAAGYVEIGMDHFALKTDPLWKAQHDGTLHRNFMGYIPRQVFPLIGLGVSAIGDSWTQFAQNEKVLEKYSALVEAGEIPVHRGHVLTPEDLVLRRHVLNLMTRMRTDWSLPENRTEVLESVASRLAEASNDGLVEIDQNGIIVTEKGRPFLRNICMAFDARLNRKTPTTQIFSKTL